MLIDLTTAEREALTQAIEAGTEVDFVNSLIRKRLADVHYEYSTLGDKNFYKPKRAPLAYSTPEALVWLNGYEFALNDVSQRAAAKLREVREDR